MHAVFIEVEVDPDADLGPIIENLEKNVIPGARESGARAGYWLGNVGGSRRVAFMVFDSEQEASEAASRVPVGETPPGAPASVKITSAAATDVLASF